MRKNLHNTALLRSAGEPYMLFLQKQARDNFRNFNRIFIRFDKKFRNICFKTLDYWCVLLYNSKVVFALHCFNIWRGIEVVITGRTRNAFVLTDTWVRIPPSPPIWQPIFRKNGLPFFFSCVNIFEIFKRIFRSITSYMAQCNALFLTMQFS